MKAKKTEERAKKTNTAQKNEKTLSKKKKPRLTTRATIKKDLDFSEHKRAEETRRESESRYRILFEMANDAIFMMDQNIFIDCNAKTLEIFGCTQEQIIGQTPYRFSPDVQPDGRNSMEKAQEKINAALIGQPQFFEWQHSRYDGTLFDAEVSLNAVSTAGKYYLLTVVRNITQRKRAEQAVKSSENHYRQLNEELEQRVRQRTTQLEASNKELEAFSYSVSHDLRAPLRAIDCFSRIVLEEFAPRLDDEGRRLLDIIRGNTHKMGQLIDDLLAFSRLNRQQMAFAPVDLAALADVVFSELKSVEKGRRIELEINALPAAFGDRSMLRQVLQNLLANAIKFTRTRSQARIELTGHAGEGENVYQVKDNGVGFDMEYSHKLFGVFQRLHNSKEFEGTGVGLAIVQRIVLRHGGRVWAESRAKSGATFYFSLPTETSSEIVAGEDKPADVKEEK